MRSALTLALVVATLPARSAERPIPPPAENTAPEAPPSPPPIVCEVWGFKWEGEWVKHADHCLKTTDLKQAIDYAFEINRYSGWIAATNIPAYCRTTYSYLDNAIPADNQPDGPPLPVYVVWAFKLTDGKWVKSEEYSWDSSKWTADNRQRLVALDLAKRINAVPGWKATTNAPACDIPENQRHAYGGVAIGSPVYYSYGSGERYDYRGLSETNGGWSRHGFRVPSDAERQRIHDRIYEENMQSFQQSMDDFNNQQRAINAQ
jgi:hypothetical protein